MQYFIKNEEFDIIKGGRSHKYVKRTGSPGNYRYWYKLPDGRIVEGDDAQQEKGRLDHMKRLLIGREKGHHAHTDEQIKQMVGGDSKHFQTAKKYADRVKRYNTASGNKWQGRHFDHDFEDSHLHEGKHHDVGTSEYASTHGAGGEAAPARTEAPARPAAASNPFQGTGFMPGSGRDGKPSWKKHFTGGLVVIQEVGDGQYEVSASSQHWDDVKTLEGTFDASVAKLKAASLGREVERTHQNRQKEEAHGSRDADGVSATPEPAARPRRTRSHIKTISSTKARPRAAAPAPATSPAPSQSETSAAGSATNVAATLDQVAQEAGASNSQSLDKQEGESNEQYQARLMRIVAQLGGPDFSQQAEPAQAEPEVQPMPQRERARMAEATARVNREIGPRSQGATALAEASPDFAPADEPIARMEAVEARGGNPYLARAKEIFHNIQHDVKPERREVAKHLLQAIDSFGTNPIDSTALLNKYKEISGRNVRGLSAISDEFEKATFISLNEVIENKPLDIEVERMKRGYAAKQFARMKPFLKDSWKAANPSAPPPYPTFGDVKSWTEHGGSKPDWAGTTRLAMPQEVYQAAHKGPDGKPKYPPAWMPIHMMPVWNYVMKKSTDDSPYQTRNVNIPNGRLQLGNQAAYQEGFVIAALRKYVQMRGGADQLTDIPSSKLQEVGLTHSDIFKGMKFKDHDLSEGTLKKMLQHKIIDPVAILPFIDEAMKESGTMTKKSFSLVISEDLGAFDFRKSYVVEDHALKKSLIEKIKKLRSEKGLNG